MDLLSILNTILSFLLALYADPIYPRKIVQEVVDFMDRFLRNVYLPSLQNEIIEILKQRSNAEDCLGEIEACFKKYSNIFEPLSTEHKRFNLLKKKGFFEFEEFVIGESFTERNVQNEIRLVPEKTYGIHVPLRKTLKLFLEIPGMFKQILDYMKKLTQETYIITNFLQADFWLRKYSNKVNDDIVLPLFIFYDELEVGNALGSHAGINKFGAVYALIACLPPHVAAQLSSIILSTLIYAEDKKKSTNKRVFAKLIEEINFLAREGITITVEGVSRRIKFQLALVLGDNLGLNSILGFTEFFNSNYFCRICKISKESSLTSTVENKSLFRTRENYEEEFQVTDVSKRTVKERCAFNEIDNFHVAENLSVDVMHDVLEGVCIYVMQSIIYSLVFIKKYFTLEVLNYRIQNFEYGSLENSNKPPVISVHKTRNTVNMKMSASEMLCLTRYFGLIIGDLIPENEECWQLYKYLRQILDIVTSPRIIRNDAKVLEKLVESHNSLYVDLFGALKPKFHNLLHYPRILIENGPCGNFWGMRFESRHRQLKSNAQATSCSKNLLKMIATKQILKLCNMIHTLECEDGIKCGSCDETNSYNYVEVFNTMYKIGTLVVTSIQNSEIEFGEIAKILKVHDEIHFQLKIFEEITFGDQYQAFIVHEKNQMEYFNYKSLPNIAPCLSVKRNNVTYVATRYKL